MKYLEIMDFKAYWDVYNKFGSVELFFSNNTNWQSPTVGADEFAAMLSILQFKNVAWHVSTRSIVKIYKT